MTSLEKLIRHFERFPGIGSRQAKRFAFHILTLPQEDVTEISELISTIRSQVTKCASCHRFFSTTVGASTECSLCASGDRDRSKLTVVERDSDIDAIERGGVYDGLYFVLGGTVPLIDSPDTKKLRGNLLKLTVAKRVAEGLGEVILAFAINPDGENTGRYIEMLLREHTENSSIKVTYLGRGLSTGSELEYADPETIKNSFKNRG